MDKRTCSIDGCEREFHSRQRCQRHYSQLYKSETREPTHCKYCGELFMPRSSVRQHCYETACESERGREVVREFYARERAAGVSKWQREKGGARRYRRVCQWCGVGYPSAKRYQKYCGYGCAREARRGRPRYHVGEVVLYVPPSEVARQPQRTLIGSACKMCGQQFITFDQDRYCSSACRMELTKRHRDMRRDKKRAGKRGAMTAEKVDRKKVFEADGYRCHICKCLTDPSTTFPHPRYPTIDHIIPISLGGQHVQSNTATACHGCNLRKNATGVGDQLRLFSYV